MTRSQPPKNVLALFDASGARFNKEAVSALGALAKGNTPFIKASAVVGIEGLLNIAFTTVSKLSGRSFKTFKDRDAAMEWLIGK